MALFVRRNATGRYQALSIDSHAEFVILSAEDEIRQTN